MTDSGSTTVSIDRHGPFHCRLTSDRIAAYAAVTGDRSAAVSAGRAVPAVYPVTEVFDAQAAANGDLPAQVWHEAIGGVHGEHDLVVHRPLSHGESLESWSEITSIRSARPGTRVVLHIEQFDTGGRLVVEQWWTTLLLGVRCLADHGSAPRDHHFPDTARGNPLGSATQYVDSEVTTRYAEISGDWSAHHFELDAARSTGFDYLFTHGLWTMGVCARGVLDVIGVDDPGRVRRVAVRFASPTPLGSDLTISVYGIDPRTFAFEAAANAELRITQGRLELRS
ncbi:MaoC/PaaZ C-terminal domain-containing protein [Nocardia sp. NBC_01377]|uniref:MaoC/PaaZ C-terminal domain-containing protein n=1 Tax=Nocardia sp. NBC_01377 TaxID=2903595 RepID=UPI003246D551